MTKEDRAQCEVLLWDGKAPKLWALDQHERQRLAAALKEIEQKWGEAQDWPSKARLLKPYLDVLFPKDNSGIFGQDREVTYQSFSIMCGSLKVRGAQALFSFLEGGVLVLAHPDSASYLVIGEYQPQAQEQRRLLTGFFAQYRAELERAENPRDLPAGVQKQYLKMQEQFEAKEAKRVRFWDVNGMLLQACPGSCPEGTIRYALDQLHQEAHDSFMAMLAIYDTLRSKNEESGVLGGRLSAVLETWPKELGKNPWFGARLELERIHNELVTFSPPPPEVAKELWGSGKPLLPEFDGTLAGVIRVMRKSLF
ncbi:MAG: hypothetical protein ACK42L_04520 [Thermoanaerobaculum sp.]